MENSETLRACASESKAWPFEEARKILRRLEQTGAASVTLATGYGPSGLPHIGTFGEVARTSMVRHALHLLAPDVTTRLICFSDDMDGLRKVPDNLPQQEMLAAHLDQPLTRIPDPYGTHDSFGAHNNARLRAFLDTFGFEYEFASASEYYQAGRFDATLGKVLENYDAVMAIILPTLGAARRKTYSPFLPICPQSGRVLMVPITVESGGRVSYLHPDTGARVETAITGGACKLQWKADWAMRWLALGVDYEMAGKDLDESVKLSARICKAMGGRPPEGLSYELFLDEKGEKISKSKGNGLSVEQWLSYAPPESLALYMFQAPRKAKRLFFDVIPKAVDDYMAFAAKYPEQETDAQLANPAYHIHAGAPPPLQTEISFALLLNLVSASNADNAETLWGFIRATAPDIRRDDPFLARLVTHALAFFEDFVRPHKSYRAANAAERAAMEQLAAQLAALPDTADAEAIQSAVYAVGKAHFPDDLRGWFRALYEVLLGQSQGPRFGSFAALYGRARTIALIGDALAGRLLESAA